MRRIAILMVILLAAGCTTPKQQDEEEAVASEPAELETVEEPAPEQVDPAPAGASMWSEEGLEAQPRLEELAQQTPPDMGTPATTDWRSSNHEIPSDLGRRTEGGPTSPGTLITALSRELRFDDALGVDVWEQTTRVHQEDDDRATAVILRWGVKDDSLAGMDLRVQMATANDVWFVEELEERFHCRRGVSDGLCL